MLVVIIPGILGQATLEPYPSTDNTRDPWASHSRTPILVLIIPEILGQATLEPYPGTDNTKDPWASHSRTLP